VCTRLLKEICLALHRDSRSTISGITLGHPGLGSSLPTFSNIEFQTATYFTLQVRVPGLQSIMVEDNSEQILDHKPVCRLTSEVARHPGLRQTNRVAR